MSVCARNAARIRYKKYGKQNSPSKKRKKYTDRKDESRGSIRKHWDKGSGL
jgi:hypothetical protein